MDKKNVIYVRRGNMLRVKCLEDMLTGEGYFLIVNNENGMAVRVSEIVAGGVRFTADKEVGFRDLIRDMEKRRTPAGWELKLPDGSWISEKKFLKKAREASLGAPQ